MKKSLVLNEQPYDAELLKKSRLYLKSRKLFLAQKGSFSPQLLSSPRSLGSLTLIKNKIEYSPLATELEWSITDKIQKKDLKHFEQIRSYVTNVFHEQNHRILWTHLTRERLYCPEKPEPTFRFLNLIESLVIILDMALGDELEPKAAASLYEMRVTYSPGSPFMRKLKVRTLSYRNALQIALHTTYLRLCGLHIEDIPPTVHKMFSSLDSDLVGAAIERSLLIDPLFVELTNPIWQKKHSKEVSRAFQAPRKQKPLILSARKPLDDLLGRQIFEKWLQLFEL